MEIGSWSIITTRENAQFLRLKYGVFFMVYLFCLAKVLKELRFRSIIWRWSKPYKWWIRYVPREVNQVVDCLTKADIGWKASLQVYDDAPNEVLKVLQ
ncbi:hypothetical protein Golob_015426 [Gossypium lobatum]|uniref:RNase H type-1 domain-containing protein n=1 Tax=Gossypium lobatum TaxID=34289 RepID=A0A7J8M128_9ROSI|nr:hypothetical protein [Gossypium lobatum]